MKSCISPRKPCGKTRRQPVWLFDLDDTLHDATTASMGEIRSAMGAYMVEHLALSEADCATLRTHYWKRYGATLLGLVRHHGVQAAHFLHQTHALPGLEQRVRGHGADLRALARLPGRKFILTNAPTAYALRVLGALGPRGIVHCFDGVFSIEDMHMFGHLRPKPDARMLRRMAARLGVPPSRCVLVEDTLEHQKAACRVGMQTVWMQRWLRGQGPHPHPHQRQHQHQHLHKRPAYVGRRVRRLLDLL